MEASSEALASNRAAPQLLHLLACLQQFIERACGLDVTFFEHDDVVGALQDRATIDARSGSYCHAFSQEDEMIFDKSEKICGKNLPLS